eukprot:TRINITY_DN6213_c0_g1_i4.p1 TRINITY_DN6213_c0_g1~~TRINITY_DN6213_c0_g1_i4.p1  ORF type:complete len:491 (+),score=51.37 TRINITY_DN6213_c0_g1_i4:224-1696(+)
MESVRTQRTAPVYALTPVGGVMLPGSTSSTISALHSTVPTSNGRSVTTQKRRRVEAPIVPVQGEVNNDLCDACGEGGELLCCDSCPNSFHLRCLNPPLAAVPDGNWYCRKCRPFKNEVPPGIANSFFGHLLQRLNRTNPSSFFLPPSFTNSLPQANGSASSDNESEGEWMLVKSDGESDIDTEAELHKRKQTKRVPVAAKAKMGIVRRHETTCTVCEQSELERGWGHERLLHCAKCPRSYHLYCLDPPMFYHPHPSLNWVCAYHDGVRGEHSIQNEMLELRRGPRDLTYLVPKTAVPLDFGSIYWDQATFSTAVPTVKDDEKKIIEPSKPPVPATTPAPPTPPSALSVEEQQQQWVQGLFAFQTQIAREIMTKELEKVRVPTITSEPTEAKPITTAVVAATPTDSVHEPVVSTTTSTTPVTQMEVAVANLENTNGTQSSVYIKEEPLEQFPVPPISVPRVCGGFSLLLATTVFFSCSVGLVCCITVVAVG